MRSENWDLNRLAGGGFKEKVTAAVNEVAKNIMDPNTNPTKSRKVTATITFNGDKQREMVNIDIAVKTSLAPQESVEAKLVIGQDVKGRPQVKELLSGTPGQEFFDPDDSTLKHDDGTPVEESPKSEGPVDFRKAQKRAKEAK